MPSTIKCRKECLFNTLLVQAITRKGFYWTIVQGLNTLMALQYTINGQEMAGWSPLNKASVKTIIENCTASAIRSQNDINIIKDTMKNGCEMCHRKESVQIQEMLADYSEEAVLSFIQEDSKGTK